MTAALRVPAFPSTVHRPPSNYDFSAEGVGALALMVDSIDARCGLAFDFVPYTGDAGKRHVQQYQSIARRWRVSRAVARVANAVMVASRKLR